jgi:DNA-binding NtrC family response regulator
MKRDNLPGTDTTEAFTYADQRVLILDQNSVRCAAEKCDALAGLLQRSLGITCVRDGCVSQLPHQMSSVPDLVLVRPAPDKTTPELIASCREKWSGASILALLCARWDRLIDNLPSFLSGVDDFLSCPFQEAELLLRIKRLLQAKEIKVSSSKKPVVNEDLHFGALVGESGSFVRAIKNIPALAQSDTTVLICGETGTGKELFSRAIHYHSPRRDKPFIPVNCAALPEHLFENELFGHVKGAFTDANASEKGLIAEAEGGTLILDEVDSLSLAAQSKLLRFLQNGEYRSLGSPRSVTANVRIIAATNADLFDLVKAKLFREDLFYRLNALSLTIPALRERLDDIVHLSNHFLVQYATEHHTARRTISCDALHKLTAYGWPGNVRELEGVIRRALVLTSSAILQATEMNLPHKSPESPHENPLLRQAKTNMIHTFELSYLTNLLAEHHGNITHAAIAAGKQRSTLQRLLRKYSLNPRDFRI